MTRPGPLLSPLLIGRDDVLDLAERRLAEAAAGKAQFLLLSGEAGIGKSRLLGAIERVAQARGFLVSGGALAPQDQDVPAALFLDLGRTLLRQPIFDDLGQTLIALVSGIIEAERPQRRLLVHRTVDLIGGAVQRPTMLAFEDLQWADDVSLEILSELARHDRGTRLMLAGTYRSDATEPGSMLRDWRARLVTQRLVEDARLDRLTPAQAGLMTTLIMGTGLPAPGDVVAAVYERTDGVPLHIEELLGALGPAALRDGRAIREADVPDSIEAATLQRVRRLSPEAQAVARAGAIIGRCFVPVVLAGIMDVPLEAVDQPLQELVDQNILDPPGLRGLYDYRHQLLRDALYRSVPERERRRFHARAAEFGAKLEGASEIHASVHFERAGMRREAFRAAVSGARAAARLSSHREAFELYRRAVDNMPDDVPAAERAAIFMAYSDEAGAIELNDVSERFALEARDLFLAAGDRVNAAVALINVSTCWRREGHPLAQRIATAEQIIAELEAESTSHEREVARCVALEILALGHMDAHDLERARELMLQYRAVAEAIGIEAEVIEAAARIAELRVIGGEIDAGLAAVRAAADEARARGYESVAVTAYRDAALLAIRSMEYGHAATRMDDARRYADAIEQSHCARVMASTDSMLAWAGGDWDEALRIGEQALADHDHGRAGAIARWALGYVAAGRGDTDAATKHLETALQFGEQAQWLEMTLPARWGLAENALVGGNHGLAIEHCEAAVRAAVERGEHDLLVPFVVTGVRAYLGAGRPDAAALWLERALEAIGPGSRPAAPAADHGRGLVRLASGSVSAAREALDAAIRGWDDRGRTWEAQWARLDLAGALLRSNRYVDGQRLITEVRSTARRLHSQPLAERIDDLERLARGRGAEQEAWHPLTIREFEVARQIGVGMTNAEIAAELFVAPKTVSAHVEHILAKLGAARRAEIATWVSSIQPRPAGSASHNGDSSEGATLVAGTTSAART
jgi:DNA-binding CsgD family transcriptional regulator